MRLERNCLILNLDTLTKTLNKIDISRLLTEQCIGKGICPLIEKCPFDKQSCHEIKIEDWNEVIDWEE